MREPAYFANISLWKGGCSVRIKGAWTVAVSLLIIAGLAAGACGGGDEGEEGAGTEFIRGTLIQINESPSGDRTESIVIKVDDQEVTFLMGEEINQNKWSPSHLKGHLILNPKIGVSYQQGNGTLIAVGLKD